MSLLTKTTQITAFITPVILYFSYNNQVFAQSIIPNNDGTGTIVNSQGNQLNITGGSWSGDRQNLFHSFSQFGLNQNEIANFQSNPNIINILGRITGGNPSLINGLIQVTGGNSNLYLMNPSGIVFGANSSLNVPSDFTATTATGIGFGNNWFSANGSNNYQNLTGNPSQLAFTTSSLGSIINLGNLNTNQGNLNLLAGTVLSNGQLSAPNGQVNIVTVPESNLIKISQNGSLLSLEINPLQLGQTQPNQWSLPVTSLPQLLTGGNLQNSTNTAIDSQGNIILTNSQTPINQGDIVVKNLQANSGFISANNNVVSVEGTLQTTKDLKIIANHQVIIRDTINNPFIAQTGGNLYIKGQQKIDILALNHPEQRAFISGGNLTLQSDGIISGDAHFYSHGQLFILGDFISLNDPIIKATGDVIFGNYTGASLKVEAGKSIIGGNITITNPDNSGNIPISDPDYDTLTTGNALILRSGVPISSNVNFPSSNGGTSFNNSTTPIIPVGIIQVGNINVDNGTIELKAINNINTQQINANNTDINMTSITGNIIFNDRINGSANLNATVNNNNSIEFKSTVGDQTPLNSISINNAQQTNILGNMNATGDITFNTRVSLTGNTDISIESSEGAITANQPIFGNGNKTITLIADQDITANNIINRGKDVNLISNNGVIDISAGRIDTSNSNGNGGNISIKSKGDITTAIVLSASLNTAPIGSRSGNININSISGEINTIQGLIDAGSSANQGQAGMITLAAFGNIKTSDITTGSNTGNGANINITSSQGSIDTTNGVIGASSAIYQQLIIGNFSGGGDAGNINLIATNGDINTHVISAGSGQGSGGNVNIKAGGNINTGSILTKAAIQAGNITIKANEDINTGIINASATIGNGGNVFLDPPANITVSFINTQGGSNGVGGNVDITTSKFFRARGTFIDQNNINASISTSGNLGGGNINIIHGGKVTTAFIVGNPSINGTRGAITSSANNTIINGIFPSIYTKGNIDIIANSQSGEVNSQSGDLPDPQKDNTKAMEGLPTESQDNYTQLEGNQEIESVEDNFSQEFESNFDNTGEINLTKNDSRLILTDIESKTGVKPAIVYILFSPEQIYAKSLTKKSRYKQDSDRLELLLVTGNKTIRKSVKTTNRKEVLELAKKLTDSVANWNTNSEEIEPKSYLNSAQQLYKLLIAPLETELKNRGIQNIMFVMDSGLRAIPLAALHDGEKFLVEKYSIGLAPSLNLTNTDYVSIKDAQILAMGASDYAPEQQQDQLPAVPIEIKTITQQIGRGQLLLNQDFTLNNLKLKRQQTPFQIIHLATHANFKQTDNFRSFIQLYDSKLRMNDIRNLGWNNPPVELLVLSACKSAIGDEKTELGFAGLAVQTGVKSAIASLWPVSDAGTFTLMAEFYQHLKTAPIKAEALRQAQLAMIQGKVKIVGNKLIFSEGSIDLGEKLATELRNSIKGDLSHPNYWAAFTLIGSPW
jgi:filamentous hemagglutinin family protein